MHNNTTVHHHHSSHTYAVFGSIASCTHPSGRHSSSECARVAICMVVSGICGLLCCWVVFRKLAQGKKAAHQAALVALGAVQAALLTLRFSVVLGKSSNVDLDKIVVFLGILLPWCVTWVFVSVSSKVFASSSTVLALKAALSFLGAGLFAVFLVALSDILPNDHSCKSISWILMSSAGLASCLLFAALAFRITRKLAVLQARAQRRAFNSSISPLLASPRAATTDARARPPASRLSFSHSRVNGAINGPQPAAIAASLRRKRRKLRNLILFYLAAAFVAWLWDLYSLGSLGDFPGSCSNWIKDPAVYLTVYVVRVLITLDLPILAVAYQFWD